jgi:hypothetical protein
MNASCLAYLRQNDFFKYIIYHINPKVAIHVGCPNDIILEIWLIAWWLLNVHVQQKIFHTHSGQWKFDHDCKDTKHFNYFRCNVLAESWNLTSATYFYSSYKDIPMKDYPCCGARFQKYLNSKILLNPPTLSNHQAINQISSMILFS